MNFIADPTPKLQIVKDEAQAGRPVHQHAAHGPHSAHAAIHPGSIILVGVVPRLAGAGILSLMVAAVIAMAIAL